jgi:shikimate 5-dehydrogenase
MNQDFKKKETQKKVNSSKIKVKDIPKSNRVIVNCTSTGCETSRDNTDELIKAGLKEKDFVDEIRITKKYK